MSDAILEPCVLATSVSGLVHREEQLTGIKVCNVEGAEGENQPCNQHGMVGKKERKWPSPWRCAEGAELGEG